MVLDYDDWNHECVWPDTNALGVVVMGSERFSEHAPALPAFKSSSGSVHGGNASGKQRITVEQHFSMQIAAAADTPEAGMLVQQLQQVLFQQSQGVGGKGEDVCAMHQGRGMWGCWGWG